MAVLGKSHIGNACLDRIGLLPSGRVRELEARVNRVDRVLIHDIRQFNGLIFTPNGVSQPRHTVTVDDHGFLEEWSKCANIKLTRRPLTHHYTIERHTCFEETTAPGSAWVPTGLQCSSPSFMVDMCGCIDLPLAVATAERQRIRDERAASPATVTERAKTKRTGGCTGCGGSGSVATMPKVGKLANVKRALAGISGMALAVAPFGLSGIGIHPAPEIMQILMVVGAGIIGAVFTAQTRSCECQDGCTGCCFDEMSYDKFSPDKWVKICTTDENGDEDCIKVGGFSTGGECC